MNKDFETLNPQAVWRHFKNIMAIPHPSGHEAALGRYITNFATSLGLESEVDGAGNVIVRKGATEGMESRKGVILQAHLDMVPQKNGDKVFDFESDPIEGYIDGDWVRADGTTLGADNGLGVAAALAILEDTTLKHGDLELLFTASEETGMDGAYALTADQLRGDILLNLDTEEHGELCIGCAGGLDLIVTFDHELIPTPQGEDYVARRLMVGGLRGGHSGIEIDQQRGNAIKLLFRFLRFTKLDLLIAAVDGGSLKNAIPREAYVDILIQNDDLELFEEQVARYEQTIAEEHSPVESSIKVSLSEIEYPECMIEDNAASCMVWSIAGAPDGVYRMSNHIPGLVQTSSNLGVIRSEGEQTTATIFVRSSMESEKIALADHIASVFELADAEVECDGSHPAWQPNTASPILNIMKEGYRELFGSEPKVLAVHAGLECGLIGATYPRLDMISFGPTIVSPHSPAERAQISSVADFYRLLCYTIESVLGQPHQI
ncbi:MAG: aminoacyl-histidine dipeptidase [Rikenellaceae bacterium]